MTFELKFVPVIHTLSCTFSCSLRTATIAIGTILLVLDAIFIISDSIELANVKGDDEEKTVFERPGLIITAIVISLVEIITCIMLLFGAWKERSRWLLPQLILLLATIVVTSLLLVVICIIAFIYNPLGGFILLVVGTLIIVIHMYAWVICYSYYRQLEEKRIVPRDSMSFENEHPTTPLHANAA